MEAAEHRASRPREDPHFLGSLPTRRSAPRDACTQTYSTETEWLLHAARRIRSSTRCTRTRRQRQIARTSAAKADRAEWFPSFSGRERELDAESRSPANLRRKVYRTVVKLYNSERAGQSDAAAAGSRCKEKLKNFLAILHRNAFAGIAHGNLRHFAAAAEHQAQLPAAEHGLDGVEHKI